MVFKQGMLMKQNEYISPDLQQYLCCCERGFSISGTGFNPNLGGWDEGDYENGSAE